MQTIGLELTNQCNRRCRHCFRNRADPPGFLALETAEAVLAQAASLGFKQIYLTGGEVALYPHLGDLLRFIAGQGFLFTMVTNGHRFPEAILPLLLEPLIRDRLAYLSFSLDGVRAETHDGLRGPQSFREVSEALLLCRNHQLPFNLKTVLTNSNRGELAGIACLGDSLGAVEHDFLSPLPTPDFIRDGLLPSPEDLAGTVRTIRDSLMGVTRSRIKVDGYSWEGLMLNCGNLVDYLNVDYQGNLMFCCLLSHMTQGDGIPTSNGGELLADLKHVPLSTAIVGQFRKAAEVMEARLNGGGKPAAFAPIPCLWCLKYFGKLAWLKDFPDSPWTSWLWPENP